MNIIYFLLFISLSCQTRPVHYEPHKILQETNEVKKEENDVRIFWFNSVGIKNDAEIVKKVLAYSKRDAFLQEFDPDKPQRSKYKDVGLNIFLEKVVYAASQRARENWIIVNPEFVQGKENYRFINKVLCKSHHCVDHLERFKKRNNLKFSVHYIGFTSVDLDQVDVGTKNFNLFLHAAGKSGFKQTGIVLEAWRRNPSFPQLVVTCIDVGIAADCAHRHLVGENSPAKLRKHANITLYNKYLSSKEIDDLRRKAGFVIAPSEVEGFGHYINEARSAGSIVVTTDYPPMNELIQPGYGFLVNSRNAEYKGVLKISRRKIEVNDLVKVIEKILTLSDDEKKSLAHAAEESFKKDQNIFYQNFAALIQNIPYGTAN